MKKFVTIGEVMQRLTPPNHDKLEKCTNLNVTYGGSEANIAIGLANFNHDVRMATIFPDNPLGVAAYRSICQYGIDLSPTKFEGDILGTYYLEVGHSIRSSSVIYNRKYSAIALSPEDTLKIDEILSDRTHLHISGITLALGEGIKNFTIKLVKAAFERGLTISFDFNYRAKLWTIEEAAPVIRQVLPYVHIVFASLFDIETIGGYKAEGTYETLEEKRQAIFDEFMKHSNCKVIFGTMREQYATHRNSIQAYCYTEGECMYSKKYDFEIIDRVGAGDAFVVGVINLIDLKVRNYETSLEYGMACGALKHTINGDVLLTTDKEVQDLINSDGFNGIKR